jgi:hypothetical protein
MNESLQQVFSISLTIFSFVGHLAAFKLHFTLSFAASTSGRYTGDQKLPSLLTKLRCYLVPSGNNLSSFSFQLSRRPSKLSGRNSAESNVLHCISSFVALFCIRTRNFKQHGLIVRYEGLREFNGAEAVGNKQPSRFPAVFNA